MAQGSKSPWGPHRNYWAKALAACAIAAAVAALYPRASTRPAATTIPIEGRSTASARRDEGRVRDLKAMVTGLNEAEAAERKAFVKDGWAFVDEAAPDLALLELSDEAIEKDPDAVFVQIQSNAFSGDMLERLSAIAQKSKDARLRYAAVDALGRSHEDRAQALLQEVYGGTTDAAVRDQAIQMIRPKDLDDASSRFLAGVMADRDAPEGHRNQASFALAMASLLQPGGKPPEKLLAGLGPAERERFMEAYRKVQRGIAHRH